MISPRYSSDKNYLKIGICLQLDRCSIPFGTEYTKEGGDPHGKFIILSFGDGEDAVFANTITALASVADFSTVTASADTPLLFGSLQIDPQRRLVWKSGQTVDLTPMEFDILLLLARRPGQVFTARQIYEAVRRTPMTPAGRGSPAWSISSAASLAPTSSKRCGAMDTVSHQNSKTAPPRLYRGGAAVILQRI